MKPIHRDLYLNQIIDRKENGLIKIITGIRRCGKSYLLFELYYKYLLKSGISDDHIIKVALDDDANKELRDPDNLSAFLHSKISDDREKMEQETASLNHINDSFKKIIIVGDIIKPWTNDKGYLVMSIYDFLLKLDSLEM